MIWKKNLLEEKLKRIDGRGYKAYKDLEGEYDFGDYILSIDHVQSDPFAPPSKVRAILNRTTAGFGDKKWDDPLKRIPLEDYLVREFYKNLKKLNLKPVGSGKSGLIFIDVGGQEILERSAVVLGKEKLEVRFRIGLPARGRKIESKSAWKMFFQIIPPIIKKSLFIDSLNKKELLKFVQLYEEQEFIRSKLKEKGLVAFVANGSILPRESGVSDKPMKEGAVAFKSPKELEVEFNLPYSGKIKGMGVPEGVTLIVGGGYHGKSTLLRALERGVYNHIPGDGREFVITTKNAVKIRAEDGRSITGVNITPFISNLPFGVDTTFFSTQNASGSTSQAANIIEALEAGADLLLIDEDTSATNFMIRDGRMQKLVSKENEPITPFIDRVKEIYKNFKVSTILVLGGSGDYFDVADKVIMLKDYLPFDVTKKAKEIADEFKTYRQQERKSEFKVLRKRVLKKESFVFLKDKKIKVKSKDKILIGKEELDLSCLEQLVDESQTRTIATVFEFLSKFRRKDEPLVEVIDEILENIKIKRLDFFKNKKAYPDNLAMPRKIEIIGAINRFRRLKIG